MRWAAASAAAAAYALAAEAILGEPAACGRLSYATIAQNYAVIDVPNDWIAARATLGGADDRRLMRDGSLPAAPRKDGCKGCEYLVVCGPYEEESGEGEIARGVGRVEGTAGVEVNNAAGAGEPNPGPQLGRRLPRDGEDDGAGQPDGRGDRGGTPVEGGCGDVHACGGGNMKRACGTNWSAGARWSRTPLYGTARDAARSLDRAFIGTIHAFCAQLLRAGRWKPGNPVFQELAQADAMRCSRVCRRWIEAGRRGARRRSRALARLGGGGAV